MELSTNPASTASHYKLATKWSDADNEVFVILEAVEKLLGLEVGTAAALDLVRVAIKRLQACDECEKLLQVLYENAGPELH